MTAEVINNMIRDLSDAQKEALIAHIAKTLSGTPEDINVIVDERTAQACLSLATRIYDPMVFVHLVVIPWCRENPTHADELTTTVEEELGLT